METPEQNYIERLKEGAVIQVKFGREFYNRLVLLIRYIYESKTEAEMASANKQIEEKNITELWVLHYETMLYLIKAAEDYAIENKLTEKVDLDTVRQEMERNIALASEDSQ